MKTIKMIMDVPKDLYAMWMARGLSLGTPLNEVFDKIRAEIEQLTLTEGGEDYIRKMAELCSLKFKVLQIIEKYREEQE